MGGKYILVGGLSLFAAGTTWFALVADVGVSWTTFVAPMVVMGTGMGCIFAPMATEAMRGVPPRLAGAASGVNTTIRQVGSVIGSAAVGALLQNRLAEALREEATARAGQLPAAYRDQFVRGFDQAAAGGLEVGAGQTGASQTLPPGLPAQVVAQIHRLSAEVFDAGFVRAMHPTLMLPIIVIVAGALACLGMRRYQRPGAASESPHVGAVTRRVAGPGNPDPVRMAGRGVRGVPEPHGDDADRRVGSCHGRPYTVYERRSPASATGRRRPRPTSVRPDTST